MATEDEENTFRILFASDCHLGFAEKDSIRGNDSFVTFEEILIDAQEKNVDLILFGGDLFHENKPSRKTLHMCMQLLRKYCFGSKPIEFQFVSDQSVNFKHNMYFPVYNCDDPNLNVAIPVFSIHGNHDDPTGSGQLASLDLLSTMGVVNYFGKTMDLDVIDIQPLLMKKGETSLALYGIGALGDERLHRLFREGNVKFRVPARDTDDWFNVLVLHQNRVAHGSTNYIPEQFLDNFLDLVVWGHEHECRIEPEMANKLDIFITQPGSTIATSMSPGEMLQKHVGLLEINRKQFKITPLPLKTVRQFYLDEISLADCNLRLDKGKTMEDTVMEYCNAIVERTLDRAYDEHTGHIKQPKAPLIRLRIEYTDEEQMFKVSKFGQQYAEKVANFKDIVKFVRKKNEKKVKPEVLEEDGVKPTVNSHKPETDTEAFSAIDLVLSYFQDVDAKMKMNMLSGKYMGEAVHEYVTKGERDALDAVIQYQIKAMQEKLRQREFNEDDIVEEMAKLKSENAFNDDEVRGVLQATHQKRINEGRDLMDSESEQEIMAVDDEDFEPVPATRGRGRGRGGRGSRGSRGGAVVSPLVKPVVKPLVKPVQISSRGRGARGGAAAAKKNSTPVAPPPVREKPTPPVKPPPTPVSEPAKRMQRAQRNKRSITIVSSEEEELDDEDDDAEIISESSSEEDFTPSRRKGNQRSVAKPSPRRSGASPRNSAPPVTLRVSQRSRRGATYED